MPGSIEIQDELTVLRNNVGIADFTQFSHSELVASNLPRTWKIRVVDPSMLTQTATQTLVVNFDDLHEFKERVTAIGENVVAILAEEEDGTRHVTTFLRESSDEYLEKIIDIQADLIERYEDRDFSFHIRVAPRNDAGEIWLPDGPYFLLTWAA
jgi:hypothetical protein